MKTILNKQHSRTKLDNPYINNSKLSNNEDEHNNIASREINKIENSKENFQSKLKFPTYQREQLYKIEENPKENHLIRKQKSKSVNKISNDKKFIEKSKDDLIKEDKIQKQIKITIQYFKKKFNQITERGGSMQSIRNIFYNGETCNSHRNSNIASKNVYRTLSNINEVKKSLDLKLSKDNLSENLIKDTHTIPEKNIELINSNCNEITGCKNNAFKNLNKQCIEEQNDNNKLIIASGINNINSSSKNCENNANNEQIKFNNLSQSTNIKTTITPFNLSSNNNKHSIINKNYTNIKTTNITRSAIYQKSSKSEKIGISFLKISKNDFNSNTINDNNKGISKNTINIIDVKKQLRSESEINKNIKPFIINTASFERSKNTHKLNNDTNFTDKGSNNYKSLVAITKNQVDSEKKIIPSKDCVNNNKVDSINKSQIKIMNSPVVNLAKNVKANDTNGGNNKYIYNFHPMQDTGRKMETLLDDIYKQYFLNNKQNNIKANYVPKKFVKETINEIKDESFELRKSKIKISLKKKDEIDENDDIYDKTLLIDELNTVISPNQLLRIQNSSRGLFRRETDDIINDDISCDIEFSKDLDENNIISGEEKKQVTKLPVFISKHLSFYNSNPNKHEIKSFNSEPGTKRRSQLIMNTSLKSLLKYNFSIKENIFSQLNFNDLINFSMCCKYIRKETNFKIFKMLINLIIIHNNTLLRLKIWKSIFRNSQLNNSNLTKIYENLRQTKSTFEEDIKKDLLRTLPDDPTFQKGKINYTKLKNVLTAYSNYNTNIGYAQGLNFIVANSIFILNDEKVL